MTAAIRITFNMPVDAQSALDRISVRATSAFGLWTSPVEGSISAEGDALVFQPADPLDFDRLYTVTLEPGVTARAGGLGTTDFVRFRFRTVPILRILDTSPRDGERNASPYGPFVIEFTAPVNEDTVLDHVTIEPAPEPEDFYGSFYSWDLRYVIYFAPKPSQTYTVTITPGIEDPYGNKTDQTLVVRFTTAPLDPEAWIHAPGSVGTYSSYEPAHIVVAHRNTDRLTLTLSKLDEAGYFEAVGDWYDFAPPVRSRIRTWSVNVASPKNAFAYTAVDLLEGGRPLSPGVYLIDLQANGVEWNRWQSRHLLISTPTHLVLKTSEEETLVWATDLETGTPVSGLILWGLDADGDAIDVDVSDSRGLARFPGSANLDWRGLTVVARSPFALADSGWTDGIGPWEFGFTTETPPSGRAYVDTDRPIYRAGQTVGFRAVLRAEQDARYSLPAAGEARVRIVDPNWSTVYERTLTIDAYGAVYGDIALAEDAALGDYRISVEPRGFGEPLVPSRRVPRSGVPGHGGRGTRRNRKGRRLARRRPGLVFLRRPGRRRPRRVEHPVRRLHVLAQRFRAIHILRCRRPVGVLGLLVADSVDARLDSQRRGNDRRVGRPCHRHSGRYRIARPAS